MVIFLIQIHSISAFDATTITLVADLIVPISHHLRLSMVHVLPMVHRPARQALQFWWHHAFFHYNLPSGLPVLVASDLPNGPAPSVVRFACCIANTTRPASNQTMIALNDTNKNASSAPAPCSFATHCLLHCFEHQLTVF